MHMTCHTVFHNGRYVSKANLLYSRLHLLPLQLAGLPTSLSSPLLQSRIVPWEAWEKDTSFLQKLNTDYTFRLGGGRGTRNLSYISYPEYYIANSTIANSK